jgi:hypothetical protein
MELVPICSTHRYFVTVKEVLRYYNLAEEDQEGDKNPRNVKILEKKGERVVEGPQLESTVYAKPLRMRKVNIYTKDKPKFANIGDY